VILAKVRPIPPQARFDTLIGAWKHLLWPECEKPHVRLPAVFGRQHPDKTGDGPVNAARAELIDTFARPLPAFVWNWNMRT